MLYLALLFQYQIDVGGAVAALIAVGSAIIGFFIAYVYLKSGVEQKKADGYKGLLEMEEARAKKYESLYRYEKDEHNALKIDYDALSIEYGQLSELFAKKSLILEAFTGQYGGVAKAIEHLAGEGKLTLPKKLIEAEIHNTSGGIKK